MITKSATTVYKDDHGECSVRVDTNGPECFTLIDCLGKELPGLNANELNSFHALLVGLRDEGVI